MKKQKLRDKLIKISKELNLIVEELEDKEECYIERYFSKDAINWKERPHPRFSKYKLKVEKNKYGKISKKEIVLDGIMYESRMPFVKIEINTTVLDSIIKKAAAVKTEKEKGNSKLISIEFKYDLTKYLHGR